MNALAKKWLIDHRKEERAIRKKEGQEGYYVMNLTEN